MGARAAKDILLPALWWGAVAGFAELVNWRLHDLLLPIPLLLGPETLWLAPLVAMGMVATIGVLWAAVGVFVNAPRAIKHLTVFSSAAFTAGSAVLMYRQIHVAAAVIFAVGIGVAAARVACLEWWQRLVHKTAVPLVVASLVWSAGVWGILRLGEQLKLQHLPPPPQAAPHVIVIVWDTVRAPSLSTYGYSRPTSPRLSELAREGILFEMAVAPSSWTLPSHGALFSGLWADQLTTIWGGPLDRQVRTVAEVFRQHGYVTAGFVANQLFCSRVHGFDRGFVHYEDFTDPATEWLVSVAIGRRLVTSPRGQALLPAGLYWGRKTADRLINDFLRWLDTRPARPFFAFLNFFDAHQPYHAPSPFDDMFGSKELRRGIRYDHELRYATVVDPDRLGLWQRQGEQDLYDGAIAYLDACLGKLIDGLAVRGLLESTVLVVTSDHGEHFGEHGLRDHGNSLYRALLHVPLMVRLPGGAHAGRRVNTPVSLCDVPATLLDLAGLPAELPGRSLRQLWEKCVDDKSQSAVADQPVFACLRPLLPPLCGDFFLDAVVCGQWWYIRDHRGKEELYNWRTDPAEEYNLAGRPEAAEVLHRLREALARRTPRSPHTHLEGPTGMAYAPPGGDDSSVVKSGVGSLAALTNAIPFVAGIVALVLIVALAQLVHLVWVLKWARRQTIGGKYFGLDPHSRRRFRKQLQIHRRFLTPALWLLSRLGPIEFERVTFRYRGVPGPNGSCSPETFRRAENYRPDSADVFVVTQLRCGTTWMQQLVYQVLVRGAEEIAAAGKTMGAVSAWLESYWTIPPEEAPLIGNGPAYRIIKTHLPVELCPFHPQARYVYVVRNPVDCFASCLEFLRINTGPFGPRTEEAVKWFCDPRLMWWTPWPNHVTGWWKQAQSEPNVYFVSYERMCKNLPTVVAELAAFLGVQPLTPEEVAKIVEHSSFAYMRRHHEAFEMYPPHLLRPSEPLLRRGRPGRSDELSDRLKARVIEFCRQELRKHGLSLSQFYPELEAAQPIASSTATQCPS